MINRVNINSRTKYATNRANCPSHVPVAIAIGVIIVAVAAINRVFADQPWLNNLNNALPFMAVILAIGGLIVLLSNTTFRESITPKKVSRKPIVYSDAVANSIAWSALRPQVTGESRNCRISPRSTTSRLLFEPIFTLQYLAVILASVIVAFLLSFALSASLPFIPYGAVLSAIEPTLKMFIYLFGGVALVYIGYLLLKPVRAIEFNKNMGVFWIEKTRIFGWKAGQSAQMPLAQIYALQIISYTNREAYINYKNQIQQQGHSSPSYVDTDTPTVTEYEINVVFCSGERVNIINHRNHKAIRLDANTLAAFLNVPVWDRDKDIRNALSEAATEIAAAA